MCVPASGLLLMLWLWLLWWLTCCRKDCTDEECDDITTNAATGAQCFYWFLDATMYRCTPVSSIRSPDAQKLPTVHYLAKPMALCSVWQDNIRGQTTPCRNGRDDDCYDCCWEHTYTMNQGTLTHIDHRHAVGSYY